MNDNPAPAWLRGLAARGVAVTIRNGRLRMHPQTAYKELTDDEVITLRHHRAAIVECVRAGIELDVRAAGPPVQAIEPTLAPALVQEKPTPPVPCPYCHQTFARCAEIKATRYDAWEVLHYNDPEEVKKRDDYATAVMLKMMKFGNPY